MLFDDLAWCGNRSSSRPGIASRATLRMMRQVLPRARTSGGAIPRIMRRSTSRGRASSAHAGGASGAAAVWFPSPSPSVSGAYEMPCSAGSSAKQEARLRAWAYVREQTSPDIGVPRWKGRRPAKAW